MKPVDFDKLLDEMISEEQSVLKSKGNEYTQGGDDRLKNFKTLALEIGVSPLVVWFIYMKKHVDSVASYVKNGKVLSDEPIQGRLMDIRNYCALGRALIDDMSNDMNGVVKS